MAGTQLPKALILGVYGAFGRRLGGWLAISHLIALLGELGVDEQAVRSSTSRLKRRGMLERERRGGVSGYALTSVALDVLAEGDRRIYTSRGVADLDEGWVLVVFSIPESRRDQRHVLRSRLTWLGFGNLAAGVWVAPARARGDAEATLARLGLASYVDIFEASYAGFDDVRSLVRRAWDLPALAKGYGEFLDAQRPVLHAWESAEHTDAEERAVPEDRAAAAERERAAFVDYMTALTQWRRLPFLDPGLPAEVLPEGWPGHAASGVFHALHDLIEPRAAAWVGFVVGER